jgi:hypothetical protein
LVKDSASGSAGKLNSQGQNLLIYGKQFGNVFIGVQPTFGYEGDPMALLFSRSASPHHGFAAYYTFLESIFKVGRVSRMQSDSSCTAVYLILMVFCQQWFELGQAAI